MALGVASPWRSRFEPSARTQEGAEAEDGDQRSAGGRPSAEGTSASVAELARAKARIEELERLVGRQQLDLDFFRKALRLADALQGPAPARGETHSSRSSKI
jgi:transposase